jgi:hypothetical protein
MTFSPKDKGIIGTIDYRSTPTIGGLPAIPATLFRPSPIFLTLTPGDRLTIAHIVGVTGRIVSIVRTVATMLTASRANVLKPNHSTTAIANHNPYLFLSYSLYRYSTSRSLNVKQKKSVKKLFFVARYLLWHEICYVCHFGSFRRRSAILAG